MNTTAQYQLDATLADGLAANNPAAWGEFFCEYAPLARGAARKCGLQAADADDVVQETLCRVLKGIANYDASKGEFRKWFSAVVRSAVFHVRFRSKRAVATGEDQAINERTKDAADTSAFAVEVLKEALADVQGTMGERTYLAFARVWNGENAPDVAAALGMSLAAVYMAKSRGLAALRAAVLA